VLTTANAAGTNGLTCLPKHRGARDKKILVIARRSALTAGVHKTNTNKEYIKYQGLQFSGNAPISSVQFSSLLLIKSRKVIQCLYPRLLAHRHESIQVKYISFEFIISFPTSIFHDPNSSKNGPTNS
jgi:hypothetical protein